jgi:hypothetical protein
VFERQLEEAVVVVDDVLDEPDGNSLARIRGAGERKVPG